ncbi:hypothetical protein SAMN05444141_11232 [Pseudovibrio denitrificans]|uniref:Uncharacterized protein n=1 Tax=Pseudovibrio denitrificans TaxID=258256 RepID=A0A1I7DWQ6_9HYPH|nr:hypothetical protein SAMN05444141_11232 [Pseudovibrio denitrificans]
MRDNIYLASGCGGTPPEFPNHGIEKPGEMFGRAVLHSVVLLLVQLCCVTHGEEEAFAAGIVYAVIVGRD